MTVCPFRVAVTGGAGFIGSHLVERLVTRGHDVIVLDDLSTGFRRNLANTEAKLVEGSVLDESAVAHVVGGRDVVVHLAALGSVPRSVDDPATTHHVNSTGTLNVLQAARSAGGVHVVAASSSSVYGSGQRGPMTETQMPRPVSPYAVSKLAAESYLSAFHHCYDLPVLPCRFFNVYGPRQAVRSAYGQVIPKFIDSALRGLPLEIHGDGRQSRDFTFVSDLVDMLVMAVERRIVSPSPVNLAFGANVDLLKIVGVLDALLGPLSRLHGPDRTGDVRRTRADTRRCRQLFGHQSPTSLQAGLEMTVESVRNEPRRDVADHVAPSAGFLP